MHLLSVLTLGQTVRFSRLTVRSSELRFDPGGNLSIMVIMSSFSEILKRLMKERGVSVRVLAQATGVPSSTLSEWTAGRDPKLGEPVVRLARFFGVSLEYLVTGKEPEQEIIGNLLEGAEDGFFTIHQGVYRVHVEKFRGKKSK